MSKRFLQNKLRRSNSSRRQQAQQGGASISSRSIKSVSAVVAAVAPAKTNNRNNDTAAAAVAAFPSSFQVVSRTPAATSSPPNSRSSLVSSPTFAGGSIPGEATVEEQDDYDYESDSDVKYRIAGLERSERSNVGGGGSSRGGGGRSSSSSSRSTADRMPSVSSTSWSATDYNNNHDCASSVVSNTSRSSHKSLFSFSSSNKSGGRKRVDDETRSVIESQSKRIADLTSEKRSLVSSCMSLHSQLHDVERQFAKVETDLMDKIVTLENDLQGTHGNAQSAILATEREMTARLNAIRALSEASRQLQRKVHAQGAVLMMKEQELDQLKVKCHRLARKSKSDSRRKASMQKALLASTEKINQLELELNLKSVLLGDARASMVEERARHTKKLAEAQEEIARLKEVIREKDNVIESLRHQQGEGNEEKGGGSCGDGIGEKGGGVKGSSNGAVNGKKEIGLTKTGMDTSATNDTNLFIIGGDSNHKGKDDATHVKKSAITKHDDNNEDENLPASASVGSSSTYVKYPRAVVAAGSDAGVTSAGAVWG